MKALVAVKRVVDHNVKVRVSKDGTKLDIDNVKMSMNPFDEIALEEAVRLKEKGKIEEIVAVSIGNYKSEETLRVALSMGADKAILIETNKNLVSLSVAKILKLIIEKENAELILLGKQSIDSDANQTGQMLAALLNISQGTFASKIEIDNKKVIVTREIDEGMEILSLDLPAVITTDLSLNEPRFIKLQDIIQSKRKSLEKINLDDLDINIKNHFELIKLEESKFNKKCIMLNSVDELVDKIKNEIKSL